jgi:hypothetical protein
LDELELRTPNVVLEFRDDGALHATGLSGESGEAWDHCLKAGDRVRLRNVSSRPAFFVMRSRNTFADGRPHHVLFDDVLVLDRELHAEGGSFTWKVSQRARFIEIGAHEDATSEAVSLIHDVVSEPDGARVFGASLTVERP